MCLFFWKLSDSKGKYTYAVLTDDIDSLSIQAISHVYFSVGITKAVRSIVHTQKCYVRRLSFIMGIVFIVLKKVPRVLHVLVVCCVWVMHGISKIEYIKVTN